ncbi:MAG: hypothetical protein JWP83_4933 [Mycobacterium sp.]|jgi:hypothetical protein|uniref:hypothetical protein n=1 Tax=Mycobacterium sp. TaxID=1785 RepID=UPI0026098D0E|nr:hypothetical protein [Mycobacterium sp.]MCW2663781.1 hypothetical protein [Mycobacterium sp.]
MATSSAVEIRFGAPENVLEVQVGTVEVDVPRSIGYFGGLVAATGLGLIEPPLALFIAAVPLYKILTNTAFPMAVRIVGEVLEGAAKPVGSDAEGVIVLEDQRASDTKVIRLPAQRKRSASRR